MKKPIIIDTDPGCDDAIAIIIALNNLDKLDIKLISTVGGNVDVKTCSRNACFLVDKFSTISIPVATGENSKLDVNAKNVHGENGLGNVRIQSTLIQPRDNAVEEMYKALMSSKQKVVILALGACTNLEKLIKIHPECVDKIDYVFIMAASMNGDGNIRPYAEFNVFANPEAFGFVLNSGLPLVFAPLELGVDCAIEKSAMLNRKVTSEKEQIIYDIIDGAYEPTMPDKFHIYDAQVILGLLHPELYEFKNCEVDLNLSEEKLGQTFFKLSNKCTGIKVQVAKDLELAKSALLNEIYRG